MRAASRLLAISAAIVLVASITRASSLSIRATIASSSSLLSFFELGSQLCRESVPSRRRLSVLRGTVKDLQICCLLSGDSSLAACIASSSVPSLKVG